MHKKNVLLSIGIGVFLGSGCSTCQIDSKLEKEFHKELNIIKTEFNGGMVNVDDYRTAIIYLGKTTGYYPQMDPSNIGYLDSVQFNKDIGCWEGWYERNKCMIY